MKRLFSKLTRFAKNDKSSRRGYSTLHFEQCEERRLMAFNITAAAPFVGPMQAPAAVTNAAPAVVAQAAPHGGALVGPLQAPLQAPAAQAPATGHAAAAVQAQAVVQPPILDVTVNSGSVVPTLATDLNLLQFYGGEKVNIPTTLVNRGPTTASGSVTVTIYLSTTQTLTGTPVSLGQSTVSVNLGPNATQLVTLKTTVPATGLTAGTQYWIIAKMTTSIHTLASYRSSDRQFEFVGTPKYTAPFQPNASGQVLYFNFIRDTFDNNFVVTKQNPNAQFNDAKSFIGAFEGDLPYPYMDKAATPNIPTLGVGINLTTYDPNSELGQLITSYVLGYTGGKYTGGPYKNYTLPTDPTQLQAFLIKLASSGATTPIISATQDASLFALSYQNHQQVAIDFFGEVKWSEINPLAKIAVMDEVYNTGSVFPAMGAALEQNDYVRAGFELVNSARTTQATGLTTRTEADYEDLLFSGRTSLGQVISP